MVIRLHNPSKWACLKPGQVLELVGDQLRKVIVDVNCPAPTRVDLVEDGRRTFVAVVAGLERLEFTATESAYLAFDTDDEVWYFTNDGDNVAAENEMAVSFTKLAGRRTRNPDVERMMHKMELNMLRRLKRVEDEAAMRLAAIEERAARERVETGAGGDVAEGEGGAKPAGSAGAGEATGAVSAPGTGEGVANG